jgi:hypothetical protein
VAVNKTQRPWTPEQDAYLVARYADSQIAEMAQVLGHTALGVHRRARFLGLLRARTLATQAIIHDYFSMLDTPLKAYVLGLLAADGSVSSDEPRIRLALHTKDIGLVEMVRTELAPHTPLRQRGDAIYLGMSSPQIVADLASYGVVPRKSYCLAWPGHLPTSLQHAFLLGYFDGDGSVSMTRRRATGNTSPTWTLYGLQAFLSSVSEVIELHTGVRVSGPTPDRRKATLHRIYACGQNARRIDGWLHKDGLGLARKRIPS